MSAPPIIYRYVSREIVTPFVISLFVFTGILFLARSLRMVDLVISRNVPAGDILILFSYIIPRFLEIAVPMSLLLAVILAFGRLSGDSELVVIRTTGVSLKQLALPVITFAFSTLVITIVIAFWIRPWANHRLGLGLFEIAKTRASAGLIAGVFNDLGQLTIYAESIEENGERLNNVIIGDRRNPRINRTFKAKYGKILSNKKERTLTLRLYDGVIEEGVGVDFNLTFYEINSLSLPHHALLEERPSDSGKRSSEMYVRELFAALRSAQSALTNSSDQELHRQVARYRVELHKRLVIPFSCLCIALIAMALGIQPSRGGHTWGAAANVAAGIFFILFYYVLFAVASAIGEKGVEPVWLIMWGPNIIFALLGWYLFQRMDSEQWLAVSQALGDKLCWLFEKLKLGSREQESA